MEREHHRIVSTNLKMGQTSEGRMSSAMYQEGLLHELDAILTSTSLGTKKKGDFDNDHGETLRTLEEMRRRRDIVGIAYYSGRAEVLERFLNRNTSKIPTYFHPYQLRPTASLVKGKNC